MVAGPVYAGYCCNTGAIYYYSNQARRSAGNGWLCQWTGGDRGVDTASASIYTRAEFYCRLDQSFAPLAKAVMQGFPGTFKQTDRLHTTGNPVRAELIELPGPEQRWAERGQDDAMHLLILGGSLGARILNLTFPAVFQHLKKDIDIEVWHQTGQRNLDETKQRYADVKVTGQVRIAAFIDDMAEAYQWADLVLCRAGALTIAELCVVGVASILVPFPHAVDDHQMTNARHLSDNGCAVLIPESALQEKWLATLLSEFHKARRRLLDMADKARQLARPDATREVGDICLEALHA